MRPDPADRRARRARPRLRRPRTRRPAVPPPTLRDPRGHRPRRLPPSAGGRWGGRAVRRDHHRGARPDRPGARGDHLDGVRGVLPDRLGPDPPRARSGDPRRPRTRLGRRLGRLVLPADHRPRPAALRPPVRAVPEPRPDPDARHRHGLRRASARRGDPLRDREVRRRPRRPDRHVPDDQGEAGHPRRRARPRVPAGGGGPPLQDVPTRDHGPRLPDRGRAEALARAGARRTRRSPRPRRSSRPLGRSRDSGEKIPCTRPAS